MTPPIPDGWKPILSQETSKLYYQNLQAFLAQEREKYTVYPPEADVFNALKFTPFDSARVLIIGQDPYHDESQAHGLAFSVRPGVPPPPSLLNIFKELHATSVFASPTTATWFPGPRRASCCSMPS